MSSPTFVPQLRVFLVEDHPAVREGLALVLGQKGIVVAGYADTAAGALASLSADEALGAVVVDLALEQGSGLEVLEQLHQRRPGLPLIVYSMHEEPEKIREALARGARGYVTKRDAVQRLVEGVLAVVQGNSFLSPRAEQSLASPRRDEKSLLAALPPQERRVFLLLGKGFGINEIAQELSLSARTIESYCERLQNRLGLIGMRELRRHAIKASGR